MHFVHHILNHSIRTLINALQYLKQINKVHFVNVYFTQVVTFFTLTRRTQNDVL